MTDAPRGAWRGIVLWAGGVRLVAQRRHVRNFKHTRKILPKRMLSFIRLSIDEGFFMRPSTIIALIVIAVLVFWVTGAGALFRAFF